MKIGSKLFQPYFGPYFGIKRPKLTPPPGGKPLPLPSPKKPSPLSRTLGILSLTGMIGGLVGVAVNNTPPANPTPLSISISQTAPARITIPAYNPGEIHDQQYGHDLILPADGVTIDGTRLLVVARMEWKHSTGIHAARAERDMVSRIESLFDAAIRTELERPSSTQLTDAKKMKAALEGTLFDAVLPDYKSFVDEVKQSGLEITIQDVTVTVVK